MKMPNRLKDVLLVVAGALVCLVLYGQPPTADAGSSNPAGPAFTSASKQRQEMLAELRTLNRLVSEQTRFLQSGRLKVVIELRDAREKK